MSRAWFEREVLDPSVGAWIAKRIGAFSTVGGLLPSGYPAYAVVPFAAEDAASAPGDWQDEDWIADLRSVLGAHSGSTEAVIGIWEGEGGLHGGGWIRVGPEGGASGQFDSSFAPGVLDGPKLELPGRRFLLFEGAVDDLRRLAANAESPVVVHTHAPQLAWPADRAWVIATDTDLVVSLVAGSPALVDALCTHPRLRAEPTTWDASIDPAWGFSPPASPSAPGSG